MESEDQKRVFSRKEISSILEKAARVSTKENSSFEDGLTQQELIRLAEESGISKNAILDTIQELDEPSIISKFNWLKRTSWIQDIFVVNGEVSDEQWHEIVREIQHVTGLAGEFKSSGKSFQWEHRVHEFGHKNISLTSKKGKTKVQTASSWRGLKFLITIGSFGLAFSLALLGIFALISTIPDFRPSLFLAIVISLLGTFPVSVLLLKSYFRKQKKQLHFIRDRISKILRTTEAPLITIEEEHERDTVSNAHDPSSKVKG